MSTPGPLKADEIYLGNFLIERLVQLGVINMFGVPGDFNLLFLDLVEDHKKLAWVGCCNELNASYAADGYARVKQTQLTESDNIGDKKTQGGVRGLACLLTTYGVGELSAVNGIAGAYAERVPMLCIVGVPNTKLAKNGIMLHHTLGDLNPDFNVYQHCAEGITKAQAYLENLENATSEIDRVLRVALESARPTYLALPTDYVFHPVKRSLLDTPVVPPSPLVGNLSILPGGEHISASEKGVVTFVVKEIERLWDAAKNPIILIDACAIRFGVSHLVKDLVKATKVKYYSTPMGKGALDEDPAFGFGGVYVGDITEPSVKAAVEAADLVLLVGSLKSDFNTGEFSYKMKTEEMIELHSDHTIVQYATYPAVSFHTILPKLAHVLKSKNVVPGTPQSAGLARRIPDGPKNEVIRQDAFWPMWGKFFREHDIILAETGTSAFGMVDVPLPKGATFVSQVLYGSIGFAGGALLGCLKAAEESRFKRRTILFIGDGSLQLTVQDISTMLRQGLKPIIVVLNNDGYVIERLIHGPDRVYNDISRWKWQELLSFFNADNVPSKSWLANNRGEFESILANEEFARADVCQLLEVKMDRQDGPRALIVQAALSAELNRS